MSSRGFKNIIFIITIKLILLPLFPSLLPGRAYMFLLRASNRIGPGPWSEPYEVVSGAGPPDVPKPPHLACKGPHVVVVTWDEPINNGASVEQYIVNMAEVN